MYCISLEKSLNSAFARSSWIKIQAEMADKLQVKYQGVYIHWCPCIYVSHFQL